ncbi:hypothetical protein EX30DRAFT_368548 [Ascodesmis nigricans]|uniref:tRNA-splicing endonuclease subunit Sen15 domain-containing protein n=1 Tax=Ascodesmis nigricans TaxID=341454 RepID=A0A4S2N858_9PEZI|nr:hypothetical protein EX30DRAFT_368548 [Ascodesmis nigricans]
MGATTTTTIHSSTPSPIPPSSAHAALANLVRIVIRNLEHQHRWSNLRVHTSSLSTAPPSSSSSSSTLSSTTLAPSTTSTAPKNSRFSISSTSTTTSAGHPHRQSTTFFPRPVITGLPPTRLYTHPDEDPVKARELEVEEEWVLPVDLREKSSVSRLAAVFDAIPDMEEEVEVDDDESVDVEGEGERDGKGGKRKKTIRRKKVKRIFMAVVAEDSTVVYYLVHDGIVKPRQN